MYIYMYAAHPSCSNQHAVIQFRSTAAAAAGASSGPREGGAPAKRVKPYIMDLKSSNKTFLNGKVIDDSRFIELMESDVIKFGHSTRDYVLVHENEQAS
jgi:smad nuclear-interacting protein 1